MVCTGISQIKAIRIRVHVDSSDVSGQNWHKREPCTHSREATQIWFTEVGFIITLVLERTLAKGISRRYTNERIVTKRFTSMHAESKWLKTDP